MSEEDKAAIKEAIKKVLWHYWVNSTNDNLVNEIFDLCIEYSALVAREQAAKKQIAERAARR